MTLYIRLVRWQTPKPGLYLLTRLQAPAYVWLWMHLGCGINALHVAKNFVILEKNEIN